MYECMCLHMYLYTLQTDMENSLVLLVQALIGFTYTPDMITY